MTAPEFRAQQDILTAQVRLASDALKAVSGGGPLGLTPDSVKASVDYRTRRAVFDAAYTALRAFNRKYARRFRGVGPLRRGGIRL